MPADNENLNALPTDVEAPPVDLPNRAHGYRATTTVHVAAENGHLDPLRSLKAHPVYAITDSLAAYMGVEKDLIQLVELLSLAAGRMVMPVNLDVQTDHVAVDLHLANRILDLRHGHVTRVDTHQQFRALEQAEFLLRGPAKIRYLDGTNNDQRPLAAALIRGSHQVLHREVSEYTCRLLDSDLALPSLWRVSDLLALPLVPTTLRLQVTQTFRGLDDFGHAFAGYRRLPVEDELANLIESLPVQPTYPCTFRPQYRGKAPPEMMLVFERLLSVFVALRIKLPAAGDKRPEVLLKDYQAIRAMLTMLPLVPVDRELTPQALLSGEAIFKAIRIGGQGLELPDLSQHGEKWFSRRDAAQWAGVGYNTAKKHLHELEGDGIIMSTLAENNRQRGKHIHFRFVDGRLPPFEWRNPFERLPDLGDLAGI